MAAAHADSYNAGTPLADWAPVRSAQTPATGTPLATAVGPATVPSATADSNAQVAAAAEAAAAVEPESRVKTARKFLSSVANKAGEVVAGALNMIGVRYKWGGNTPDSGLDCSGFVRYVFNDTLGFMLPRRSEEMIHVGEHVARNDLKPGDLVFFNTMRRTASHVGIYVGDNKFIHSPATGGKVRVEDLRESYWSRRFDGARRVEVLRTKATPSELTRAEQIFRQDHPL